MPRFGKVDGALITPAQWDGGRTATWSKPPTAIMIGRRLHQGNSCFFGFVMRSIGRGLQMLGLGVPPLAIVMQLSEAISLAQMLMTLVAAVCCFGIGRILEGYAQ
jgi:hypothetical protein